MALIVTGLMIRSALHRAIDRQLRPQIVSQYNLQLQQALTAKAAKTDDDFKKIIALTQSDMSLGASPSQVSSDALQQFKTTQLPKLLALADDTPAQRADFERKQLALYRSRYPLDDLWEESIGILGLLAILGGLFAAARLAMK